MYLIMNYLRIEAIQSSFCFLESLKNSKISLFIEIVYFFDICFAFIARILYQVLQRLYKIDFAALFERNS